MSIVKPVFIRHDNPKPEPPQRAMEVPPAAPEVRAGPPAFLPKPEEKAAKPADSEEKSSIRKKNPPKVEEKSSETHTKRKVRYEGEGGRIHTEAQIDELLDFYLMTGELPIYVSTRQRYDYRHHERLPERKELLEQRGISVVIDLSSSARRAKNVIPITGAKATQRQSGTSA